MNATVALLPLYLRLYDEACPEFLPSCEEAVDTATRLLSAEGMKAVRLPTCRVSGEFEAGVRTAEAAGVDAIVATLHLAYSPSLEAVDALAGTALPLIVMSATPDFDFGPEAANVGTLMRNHGIHGAQDLCNMLSRKGKRFVVEAGHLGFSDVAARVARWVEAEAMARGIRALKVGMIGSPFKSMGDFQVEDAVLRRGVGAEVVRTPASAVAALMPSAGTPEVAAGVEAHKGLFDMSGIGAEAGLHTDAVRAGLAVRRWLSDNRIGAFAMSFLESTKASGLPMPFLGACEAMAAGIGYAGEGDVLTASFAAAVLSAFPDATFTEMFCPDWKGGRIFLSHMGEINLRAVVGKPKIIPMRRSYLELGACGIAARYKPGRAVIANLAPMPEERFRLILMPVEVEDVDGPGFPESVRGWAKPDMPLARLLEEYCRLGGTHHSVMAYGPSARDVLRKFGRIMGWDVRELHSREQQ